MTVEKRCSRCLLPDTFPGISFDGEGVCRHCAGFVKRPLLGEKALRDVLDQRRGRTHDALVGISGGKDSCYVAYLAARRLGLRVLAVCYDFPFLVDLARENIRAVCQSLGIEILWVRSKGDLERRLLREHMLSLAPTGTTWGQCLFCHYGIDAVLHGTAKDREIPFVLGGVTRYEKWEMGSRSRLVLQRVRRLPLGAQARFAFHQFRAFLALAEQRRQFPLPGNGCLKAFSNPVTPADGPRFLSVFEYLPWDAKAIEETLTRETGWRKPDKAISWRYDCILEPLLDLTYKREFGISTSGIYLSHQVRDGLLGREEALRLLDRCEDDALLAERLRAVCEFLSLPPSATSTFLKAAAGREG